MLSASALFGKSWTMYRQQAALYAGYAAWLLLPYAAYLLATFVADDQIKLGLMFGISVAEALLWSWVLIILTMLTVELASGKKPDQAKLPEASRRLVWSYIWVSLMQFAVMLGGFLLLVIPGIVFGLWYAFAQEAVVVDGKRGLEAMSRSRELARGRFFQVLWYLVFGVLVAMLIYLVGITALEMLIGALTQTPVEVSFGQTPPLWVDLIDNVAGIFLTPLVAIYGTLTYLELKQTYAGTRDRT
jgi:hypothetical protein